MVVESTFSPGHFHGSNVFSRSNFTPFGSAAGASPFPFRGTSGFPGTTSIGNQCPGSAVASYSATRELDGKIRSISAMQVFKYKSHEELRSEDYKSNKVFTFSIQNQGNAFQQSNSPCCPCTIPGFGITSRPSSWSTSSSAGSILSLSPPNASNLAISTTSEFRFSTTSASSNSSIFGFPTSSGSQGTTTIESTASKQYQGSGVASYCATTEVDGSNNKFSVEKILSISAMPIYKDKSHEELRLEDFKLHDKGPFLNSSPFKTTDTPAYTFPSAPLSNQSSLNSPFQPFKCSPFAPKILNFTTPNNTISTAPTLDPSANPFSRTNLYPFQSQASVPQPNAVSSPPTFIPSSNPFFSTPSSESMAANSNQCPQISTTLWREPSVTLSPPIQSTSVTALDSWPFISIASKHGETAEKVDSVSTNDQSQQSQASNGLTTMKEFSSQNTNGQQYVPSSTLGVQSSLVVNPFATESPIDQSNAVASRLHGISSLPVSNNLSSNRKASLMRVRHVSSRHPSLPVQRCSRETKVPFFNDEVHKPGPIAPFLPRENPSAWVKNSLSLPSHSNSKDHEDNENSTVLTDDTCIQEEDLSATLSLCQIIQECVHTVIEKHEADVLAIMPKLPDGDYYTEPSVKELAALEMDEPGWCSQVKDFTVGRRGYGSIKFVGETDIRHLDLGSIVQFKNREVIVYVDDCKKPAVGESLNKPAEVSLLNVKCFSKKTGKQYVEGPQVDSYKEMLVKKTSEQGAEFVSYDPVEGLWKFRVSHF